MQVRSLFAALPDARAEEVVETLWSGAGARVERIVSLGQASPPGFWYDQPQDEIVLLVSGAAQLAFEGDGPPLSLLPGDWLVIPARCRHRVAWTAPDRETVWFAVHAP